MPANTLWGDGFVMWHFDIAAVVTDDVGVEAWTAANAEADETYGHAGNLRKNALHVGATLAYLWDAGRRSAHLERLCSAILNPADNV
jgi:putative ATP-dependent endonuclease of the OLD family